MEAAVSVADSVAVAVGLAVSSIMWDMDVIMSAISDVIMSAIWDISDSMEDMAAPLARPAAAAMATAAGKNFIVLYAAKNVCFA